MNSFHDWAVRWGIPIEAINDLFSEIIYRGGTSNAILNEADVQNSVRLEGAKLGVSLWRNNNGAFEDKKGRMVRFGLGNDSARASKAFKSSDLIGIRPVTVEPFHVGSVIGQFVAREIKKPGWRYTGTEREVGQANFLSFVLLKGGDAAFTDRVGSL
jgi:hypothetical protein